MADSGYFGEMQLPICSRYYIYIYIFFEGPQAGTWTRGPLQQGQILCTWDDRSTNWANGRLCSMKFNWSQILTYCTFNVILITHFIQTFYYFTALKVPWHLLKSCSRTPKHLILMFLWKTSIFMNRMLACRQTFTLPCSDDLLCTATNYSELINWKCTNWTVCFPYN